MKYIRHILPLGFFILSVTIANAQQELGSDELFSMARSAAFDKKDYPTAIALSKQALAKSPNYNDIRLFLGRIYSWKDSLLEARKQFNIVLEKDSKNKEALNGLIDLEYWNNNSSMALVYATIALNFYQDDVEFTLKKLKALNTLKQYGEAYKLATTLFKKHPENDEVRELIEKIKLNSIHNQISVGYDYIYFDKNYNGGLHDYPWHLTNIAYSTLTPIGSIIGRITYANRFGDNGIQGEIDAYPRISKMFYSYVNVGYSTSLPVFPKFRAGFSLYANLPKSFEGEVGFRYLKFSSETWIYTASVGKYYSNFWFNLKGYFVPGEVKFSQSYTLTTRYYYGAAQDYFSLGIGSGVSPDENRSVLIDRKQNYKSKRANLEWSKLFNKRNSGSINASWLNEEQENRENGTQLSFGLSFQHRF